MVEDGQRCCTHMSGLGDKLMQGLLYTSRRYGQPHAEAYFGVPMLHVRGCDWIFGQP